MNNRVKAVLESLLERFKSGDIPKAIAYATYPIPSIPSAKWSFTNRLLMYLSDTTDARGMRQWNQVGRKVKKGAKAIYILVPRFIKVKVPENEDEDRVILRGFMTQPVFRLEDTEGEPLKHGLDISLPDLPLLDKARQWGISVSAVPQFTRAYGVYSSGTKEILLASPEEIVFFHELSHAAHERVTDRLKPGQQWDQEIVAELCAQVLSYLVGRRPQDHLGNSYRYIESYARKADLSPLSACLKVLEDVERVLHLILEDTLVQEPPKRHAAIAV